MISTQVGPRVVLVRPDNSLEVGAVARAMNNLSVSSLVLVAPENYDPSVARVTGCWSEGILDALKVVASLEEAVLGCPEIIGECSGWWWGSAASPPDLKPPIKSTISIAEDQAETAVVFWGATAPRAGELELCSQLWRCPAEILSAEASFSQRVLLFLYELRRYHKAIAVRTGRSSPAPQSELTSLAIVVEKLCDRVRISDAAQRAELVDLMSRTNLNRRELGVFLNFLGRVLRSVGGR